jgi:hypothetical protein
MSKDSKVRNLDQMIRQNIVKINKLEAINLLLTEQKKQLLKKEEKPPISEVEKLEQSKQDKERFNHKIDDALSKLKARALN